TTLTASSGSTWLWSTGATSQTIIVSTAGSYTVRTIGSGGCTSDVSLPTTVSVTALPATATISGATAICSGNSTNLTTTRTLGANEAFLWSNNSSASTLSVSTAGTYSLRIRNTVTGCTSAISNSITLVVNTRPAGALIAGATAICSGSSTTLTTTRVLGTNEAYLWSDNSSASTLSVSSAGSYSLRIVNNVTACTSAVGNVINITVNPLPTTPTISGANSICSGSSTILTSTRIMLVNEMYIWSDNSTGSTLSVTTPGTYSLRIRNTAMGCNSEVSNTITVAVNTTPLPATISGANAICSGSSTTLTTNRILGTNEAYLWSDNSSANSLSVSTAGTYFLRIRNTVNGCTSGVANTFYVAVNNLPTTPAISGATAICSGSS
ncbi:MAG: hypothetical protein ACOVMN_06870, partial [Flexibacteraceae bacterium]